MKELIAYQIEKHTSIIKKESYISNTFDRDDIVKQISFALQVDKQSIAVKIEPDDKEPMDLQSKCNSS